MASENKLIDTAVIEMLEAFADNDWMVREMWPLIASHIRLMAVDAIRSCPPGPGIKVLDVGCFNGYVTYLFRRLGYEATAADMADYDERRNLFERTEIDFIKVNLNHLHPFQHVDDDSFDVIIVAQVIEHILNHPLGLMRDLARLTRPGGFLLLTTPHPATIMNAARVILNRCSLWGTREFIDLPKIEGDTIISHAEIHYREYLTEELHYLIRNAGYTIVATKYLGLGPTEEQPWLKKTLKRSRFVAALTSQRLFGSNQYILAKKE